MLPWLISSAFAAPELIPEELWTAAVGANSPGGPAVSVELPLRDGGTFTSADAKGKPLVMSFWASWCGPCRKELPALSEFQKTHPGVVFLAVNVDRDRAAAEGFLEKVDVDIPVAFDPDAKALGQYGVTSMPTLFLVDKQGHLAWKHTGYSEQKGFTELEAALSGKPPPTDPSDDGGDDPAPRPAADVTLKPNPLKPGGAK